MKRETKIGVLVNDVFKNVIEAISPDDPTGHLPDCGYTEDVPECGCAEMGRRVHDAIKRGIAKHAMYIYSESVHDQIRETVRANTHRMINEIRHEYKIPIPVELK